MPDLPDDLRALLHERAEHAPAVPTPTEALVRRVHRRRAARATAMFAVPTVATAGFVAVALGSAPVPDAVRPAVPPAPVGRDTPCPDLRARAESVYSGSWDTSQDEPPVRDGEHGFVITFRQGAPAFDRDVYEADTGATCALVADPGPVAHDLRLREPTGNRKVWAFKTVMEGDVYVPHGDDPLAEGRYRLVCAIHPSMRAVVLVGQPSA